MVQTTIDAKLHADFEEGSEEFDYSQSTAVRRSSSIGPSNTVTAYLKHIQKAKLLQPFGCMLAIDEKTFAVIAYSENAPEMLTASPHVVPSVEKQASVGMGIDARTIFTPSSAAALQKSAALGDVNLLNPVLVHCKNSGKPFYAILHRVDMGLVIDFEPVKASHVPMNAAGALQSYKLAANAISRLQNMASGDIGKLCDMVVQEIHELTGYDRVMAYKFHDDDHGEVISELRRSDLEPYLGLHYPATDLPQASRFLFMKNKVRMICDCQATPVKVVEDKRLPRELVLCGSTLRAPHGCHAEYMSNMGSVASLVIAVTINAKEEDGDTDGQQQQQKGRRLWGLVVCHHTSPRFVPFPMRYACEFLMQVFAIQLNKEVELADQLREKHILRTQTLLCDMLLRDAPMGIIREKPNIMDLVRCDGAAFYYCKNIWLLGTTPTEDQLLDIVEWISQHHIDSTGLCTDSLTEAGYPGAALLADAVCGMAAVRINSEDLLFWFRSHTAREIKWGGAVHSASDRDDGKKMHPRNSFKAFIDVVKKRSLPWEDVEMDAIHSLQLILRGSFKNNNENITMATIQGRFNNLKMQGIDELYAVTNEMVRLIETATVPILAVDAAGLVNGWNTKAATVTGLSMEDALGQPLISLVEDNSVGTLERMLYLALQGQEEENVEIELKRHGSLEENGSVRLIVNACSSKDLNNRVLGVCFVAQDVTGEKIVMDKFTRIQGDYRAIVQNPSPLIPPMVGADEFGWCSEWNLAMEKLSGWRREEIIDKKLLGEVFGSHTTCCHLKGQNAITEFRIVLKSAITGQETEKFPFGFFNRHGKYVEALLSTHKKTDAEGRITGVFCFLHIASPELQQALHMQRVLEKEATKRLKALAYLRIEIKRPLSGITFTRKLLGGTDLNEKQKQVVERSLHCERQLLKILDDMDLESIEDGYMELDTVEFILGALLDAVVSQVMIESEEKGLEIIHYLPKEIYTICLCGDQMRLQQILANFLGLVIQFTPQNGWVATKVSSSKKRLGVGVHVVHLEFRFTHPGEGLPEKMVEQILNPTQDITQEGFGLLICGKLLKLMNGTVQYLREEGTPSLIIIVELASGQNDES
ncbi:phytochrome isoform X2 [Cryptomeria japonica]|nr:phytochrome isoform X2 [Cryptomeria japonica]XP_057847048.2 phytochrome isoform X2 [Cryptomeria japonica]